MLSKTDEELLESFSEVRVIGEDLADQINAWNEVHLDEGNSVSTITQDMSGDTVVSCYTENGEEEEVVCNMLKGIGYSEPEDSDDSVVNEIDIKKGNDVSDWLNEFLVKCIEVSTKYPDFVKEIQLLEGNSQRKEEVRIVIPSNVDIRKLPARDIRKSVFMDFLKNLRVEAAHYSMIDEAFCFCSKKNEFLVLLHPYKNKKN